MTFVRVEEAKGHRYEDDGHRVRGATTWIDYGVPKPALIDWAANTVIDAVTDHWDRLQDMSPSDRAKFLREQRYATRQRALDTGTALHVLAERISKGEDVEVTGDLYGMADAFAQFLDQHSVQVLATEMPVLNRTYQYAGTLDMVAVIDGRRWLLDTKTGARVYPETALQLSAYRYAEVCLWDGVERKMPEVDLCGVVHVTPTAYELQPVMVNEEVHNVFLSAIEVGRWAYDVKSSSPIGPRVPPPADRQPVSHYRASWLRDLGWQVTPPAGEAWVA